MASKPPPNPNSTIVLDAISLDDESEAGVDLREAAIAALEREEARLGGSKGGPPPLPPSEVAKASAPKAASVAPPPTSKRPAWVAPVALAVGVAIAIFAGVKVGTSLHEARVAKEQPSAAPAAPAPPSAAPSGPAPVITVPVVEMDDKPH